jgi:hypothetical protein
MIELSSDINRLREELTKIDGFQFATIHPDWVVVYLDKARFEEYFKTDSKTYQINGVIFQGQ